jgi:HTH-type transcriptional regulator / antitoxin HigA
MPTNEYNPDFVSPPAETLRELLENMSETQKMAFTELIDFSAVVKDIVENRGPITEETAHKLEEIFAVPARFWINLENNYRESLSED